MIVETTTRQVEPDLTIVEISGRLSLGNALSSIESSLRRTIEGGARKIVVDLAGLTAIDSAGIGMLISVGGAMEQSGGAVRIAGAHGLVGKSLGIVHMDRIVPLDPDIESSLQALR